MDNLQLPTYEEFEEDAINYANSQNKSDWAIAKVAYMAGAQDYAKNDSGAFLEHNNRFPAYPLSAQLDEKDNKYFTVADFDRKSTGFTKLELASLMIAQGMVSNSQDRQDKWQGRIAELSVELAKAVLKQTNQ